ncbi:MAG: hypothetical protein K9G41_01745 [Flavobacteriales bacterium]|nr:hypothetical protein [Flavobacteriales bacterium]
MDRPAKVSLDFVILSPIQKGLFGDNVISEMTEHTSVFVTPDVPLANLSTANDDLKLKTQQALSGDKEKIQERDVAEQKWIDTFRKEAEYVQRIAAGSKLVITQSGYHSTSTETHAATKPDQADLDAWGNKGKGSIHAELKTLKGAKGLVYVASPQPIDSTSLSLKNGQLRIAKEVASDMELILTTKRKVDFQGLVSGQTYYIAALGFNTAGVGDISTVIDVVAP